MEFRRHGPHETRRRRLLSEDTSQADDARADEAPVRRTKGSASDSLPRVTDLVPRSSLTFFLLFVGGVAVIAGLEALYWFMPQWARLTTDGTIEAFDLDAEGTLAVWFSSFLLTMSGFTALAIYAVRKRREEDYHARYRVWLWAALCWFVLSIDETGSLHEGFKEMMSYLSGSRLMGDGSLWWVMAYGLVLGQLALMLWIETKGSWGCRLALIGTAACFAGAVAAQLELFTAHTGVRVGIMIEEGLEMVGDLCLLLGMGLHARFVTRNHGNAKRSKAAAVKAPKAKPKLKKSARAAREPDEAEKPEKAVKADKPEPRPANEPRPVTTAPASKPAPGISASPAARPLPLGTPSPKPMVNTSVPNSSSAASTPAGGGLRVDTAQDGPGGTHRKLSKSERKALKREQRRQGGGPAGDEDDDE